MTNGCRIYDKASDMEKAKICAYPQSDQALPHWKAVLRCGADCLCINLPDQERYNKYSDTTPSIRFHIYNIITCCTSYGRFSLETRKYVTCVHKNLHQINLQKYTPEKS